LILDTSSDLNLYKESLQNEKSDYCSSVADQTAAPKTSCCDSQVPETKQQQQGLVNLLKLDFNEWAGECIPGIGTVTLNYQ
jgi:hypothetical protein